MLKHHIKLSEDQWDDENYLKKNSALIKINYELSLQQKKFIKGKINVETFLKEFLKSNLMEHIKLQLSWPNCN